MICYTSRVCGRYSLAIDDFSELRVGVNLELFSEHWTRRYNIAPSHAPGHEVPFIRAGAEGRGEIRLGRWWLVPFWWNRPLSRLPTSFNARSEDVETKPLFREPFARRRCLVPTTGWREFQGPAGHKRAFHFHRSKPFVFAGLWDRFRTAEGEPVDSFAILTAETSTKVRPIHDRMPLPLPVELHAAWLFDDGQKRAVLDEAILRREEQLELFEVSNYGNSVHSEGPECLARVPTQGDLFSQLPRSEDGGPR
jgi:putative SOS response-associated peptidase YedK